MFKIGSQEVMKFPADAELCMMLSEQPEEVFCMRGFLCLVGISEYGKFHNQFCWIEVQRCYFFLRMLPIYNYYLYFCPKL